MALSYAAHGHLRSELTQRVVSPDQRYWRSFSPAAVFEEPMQVTSVDISPALQPLVAATSSVRVNVWSTATLKPVAQLGRAKFPLGAVRFRPTDGALIAAGGREGKVRVWDVAQADGSSIARSRGALRTFRCATECQALAWQVDGKKLVAGDNAGAIYCFDLGSGESTTPTWHRPAAHTDQIRAIVQLAGFQNLVATASYDRSLRIWDLRMDSGSSAVLEFSAEAPFETACALRSDALLAAAGGTAVRVYDLAAAKQLHAWRDAHNRTATSLAYCPSLGQDYALLSAGLDRRVNAFSVGRLALVHSWTAPAQVLALAASQQNQKQATERHIAYAMPNLLAIHARKHQGAEDEELTNEKNRKHASSAQLATVKQRVGAQIGVVGGKSAGGDALQLHQQQLVGTAVKLSARPANQKALPRVDLLLKQFRHARALELLFRHADVPHYRRISVLRELLYRRALRRALNEQTVSVQLAIINFLRQQLARPEHCDVLVGVAHAVLDFVETSTKPVEPIVLEHLGKLQHQISKEIELADELWRVSGSLEMLMTHSELAAAAQQKVEKPVDQDDDAQRSHLNGNGGTTALADDRTNRSKSRE